MSGLAEVLAEVGRENAINCTGPGEVGCKGRKGWHSWSEHRAHIAESQVAAIADVLAADATREAVERAIQNAAMDNNAWITSDDEARSGGALAAIREALGIAT